MAVVFVVSVFVADRLGIGVGSDFAVEPAAGIFPTGFARQRQPPFSESFFEKVFVEASEVSNLVNAQAVQVLFRDFADAGNLAHVQRRQEICLLPGHDPENAVGFGTGRRNFRDEPRDADPDRAVEPGFGLHLLMKQVGGAQRRAVQPFGAGHIEIGFIDRSHFDLGRERSQHAVHFFRTLAIAVGMAVHEDGLRAKLGRGAQRHGGVHAELAGFVRCRGNHAALVALSAHDYGFSLQFRIEQLFHGHEEGVHIDVEDRPGKAAHGKGPVRLILPSGCDREPQFINHKGHEVH